MSLFKDYIYDFIEDLARKTKYSFDYLMELFWDMADEGEIDFEYFKGVTLEEDW